MNTSGPIYLKISNAEDRTAIAALLFKNNYRVELVRGKKNGRVTGYFVKCELIDGDETGGKSVES